MIQLEPIAQQHVTSLARFHRENLGGKLAWLGESYTRYFYRHALRLPNCFGVLALDGERIAGFVFGTTERAVIDPLVRLNPLAWFAATVQAGLLHPISALKVAAHTLKGDGLNPRSPVELEFIAVRPDQRGQHVGKKLLDAFRQETARRGHSSFELSVGQDNMEANAFYLKNGGEVYTTFKAAGMKMNRYLFKIGS
jgi:ribosomal protein S18 acetylase RimI-like enzyme